jgi:hypothetical protein
MSLKKEKVAAIDYLMQALTDIDRQPPAHEIYLHL